MWCLVNKTPQLLETECVTHTHTHIVCGGVFCPRAVMLSPDMWSPRLPFKMVPNELPLLHGETIAIRLLGGSLRTEVTSLVSCDA